jgi:two-component system response regulator PilR (NtrC family)
MTAFGSIEGAIDAIRAGAYDYVTKPFKTDELLMTLQKALERTRLEEQNEVLSQTLERQAGGAEILGTSEPIRQVLGLIDRVAPTDSAVLIRGESGTGKELVARAIHYNSARAPMPFVTVNCSAVPETLLESELFGHMKGSFTGAIANKAGLFEVANGGTIFLDEIGDTTPAIQVKLLRVIQEREFRRVGGNQDVKVDVRIVAATNRDLEKAVAEGAFREDLYYRLDVIPIKLPPLRMRTGDIPLLSQHFLEKFSKESGKPVPTMSQEAMRVLLAHEWRGNVRELENVVERVVAFTTGSSVTDADIRGWLHKPVNNEQVLPSELPEDGLDLEGLINTIEKGMLLKALERSQWVKKRAARLLRLNTRSFRYRLEKYKIKGGRD